MFVPVIDLGVKMAEVSNFLMSPPLNMILIAFDLLFIVFLAVVVSPPLDLFPLRATLAFVGLFGGSPACLQTSRWLNSDRLVMQTSLQTQGTCLR